MEKLYVIKYFADQEGNLVTAVDDHELEVAEASPYLNELTACEMASRPLPLAIFTAYQYEQAHG